MQTDTKTMSLILKRHPNCDVEARNLVAPTFRELENIVDEIARIRREVQDLKSENISLRAQIIELGGSPR